MRFKKQMLLLCKFKSQCNKCITLQIALSPPQMIQKNEMPVRGCGCLCSQVLSPQTFMSLALADWSGHMDFCNSSHLKPNMMQNMDLPRQASVFQLSDRIRFLVPVQSDLRSSHPCREISTLFGGRCHLFISVLRNFTASCQILFRIIRSCTEVLFGACITWPDLVTLLHLIHLSRENRKLSET